MKCAKLKHACIDGGQYGLNVAASDYVDSGVRLIRTSDLSGGDLTDDSEGIFVAGPVDRRFRLQTGDVLLSRSGTVGRSFLVPASAESATFAGFLVRFRPAAENDSRFLSYVSQSIPFQSQIESDAVTSTIQNFNADRYANIAIPLPSADAQGRIADFLDDQVSRIDGAIALRQGQIGVLANRLDAAILGFLIPGGARLHGRSPWITHVPEGWRVAPLRAAWQVVDCKHRTPTYVDSGLPVVSPGDVTAGRLDLALAHRFVDQADFADLADPFRRCLPGDLVYSRNASAGTAAYVETSEPFTMGQDVCRITSVDQDQLFLMYVLNFIVTPQLDSARVGSTFTRINVDEIKTLKIPIPPRIEQTRLAQRCDDIWFDTSSAQSAISDSLKLLGERKRALITAAVSGEFDVTTASGRGVT